MVDPGFLPSSPILRTQSDLSQVKAYIDEQEMKEKLNDFSPTIIPTTTHQQLQPQVTTNRVCAGQYFSGGGWERLRWCELAPTYDHDCDQAIIQPVACSTSFKEPFLVYSLF